MATKIEELCEQVIAARTARDAAKGQLDACEGELDLAEASLSEALLADGGKCTHAGFSFSTVMKVNWKTIKEGKDKLLNLLKQGAPELVKESVNSASLSATCARTRRRSTRPGPAGGPRPKPSSSAPRARAYRCARPPRRRPRLSTR